MTIAIGICATISQLKASTASDSYDIIITFIFLQLFSTFLAAARAFCARNTQRAHARACQTYVADIFLAQSWRDPRLLLPDNMSEEYRILDVDWLRSIWRPDCFFKNAKKVTFHEMSIPNHYLWLYHDKTLLYMSK